MLANQPNTVLQQFLHPMEGIVVALPVVKRCGVMGCDRPVWARGLCDTHLSRLRRHGHLEPTRATDWGERSSHSLYPYWKQIRRNGIEMCEEWHLDFWALVKAVGDRPSPKHTLFRPDKTKPLGPNNAIWSISKAGIPRDQGHIDKRERHRLYMAEYLRRRRAADPFHEFRNGLKKTHGLTLEQYEQMLDAQQGVCAICGRPDHRQATSNGTLRRLCVDHKHGTALVRGLLCTDCNHALGLLDDSPDLLWRAIAYLANPPAAAFGFVHNGKHVPRRRQRDTSPYVTEGT
jgi:hypothetical protein